MRGASRNGATVTTDGNRRLYALTNLQKDSEYQVRISALTVNGSGPLTQKLKATTYKDDLDGKYPIERSRSPHIKTTWTVSIQ
jgi:neogenin